MPNYGTPMKVKRGYGKKINHFLDRVQKKKACGIIYNVPAVFACAIINRLSAENKHIVVDAKNAFNYAMLNNRLSTTLEVPRIRSEMLPAALNGKFITINHADFLGMSYDRFLDDCSKNNIPVLLLFNTKEALNLIRKLNSYNRILTIEQDYEEFLAVS